MRVWNPQIADKSEQIERVQRKILRFSSQLLNISCDPHDFTPVSNVLNLDSLSARGVL